MDANQLRNALARGSISISRPSQAKPSQATSLLACKLVAESKQIALIEIWARQIVESRVCVPSEFAAALLRQPLVVCAHQKGKQTECGRAGSALLSTRH